VSVHGQFENLANPEFHYETTAQEIFDQMQGKIDALVIGVGTGGTFSGVARFMKEHLPQVHCVAVETQGSILQGGAPGQHKVEGIGVSFIPKTFDGKCADEIVMIPDEPAFAMVRDLAAKEGVLAGSSGGANVAAAVQVAAYEARVAAEGQEVWEAPRFEPASQDEIARLFVHAETTLAGMQFLNLARPRRLMPRLRRLFARARLEKEEVNILRGILARIDVLLDGAQQHSENASPTGTPKESTHEGGLVLPDLR